MLPLFSIQGSPDKSPAKMAKKTVRMVSFLCLSIPVLILLIHPDWFTPEGSVPPILFFNLSKSAPYGFYERKSGPVRKGSLAALCLPGPAARVALSKLYLIYNKKSSCPDHAPLVLKRIAATRGDVVHLDPRGISINGQKIPGSGIHSIDSRGRTLDHWTYGTFTVGTGEIWVLGENIGVSWDSRYFGPVGARNIRFAVIPLFTWR